MNFERVKALHTQNNANVLEIKPGMFLEIHEKLGEAEGNRIWKFKGLVIKVKKPNNAD
jgi:ribosomal protein L19